jgi:SAM-dependent methyltransferase
LNSDEWHSAIVGGMPVSQIVANINDNRDAWYESVLNATAANDSLLELGSGTGVFSGLLAKHGRKVTLVDYSEKSVDFCREVFKQAGLVGTFMKADVLQPFPFPDNTFDCVWSSGLLEHFTNEQVDFIMKESARVSRNTVVSLVPNAFSVYYRLGKWYQESNDLWQWGNEDPKYSMRRSFVKSGLTDVREFCIDSETSFQFIYPIRFKALKYGLLALSQLLPGKYWNTLRQGYLLVTIGKQRTAAHSG